MKLDLRVLGAAAFFAVVPAAAAGGALALPVLLSTAGVLCVSPSLMWQSVRLRPLWLLSLLLWVGWVVLTCLWRPEATLSAAKLVVLFLAGLSFITAARAAPRSVQAGGGAAFFVLAALLSVEAFAGFPLNRAINPDIPPGELALNPMRGAMVSLALIWGVAGGLLASRRRLLCGLALLVAGVLSVPFGLFAHIAAFGLGLAAFALALLAPRLTLAGAGTALALWVLAAPFATPIVTAAAGSASVPFSWTHRLAIWRDVSGQVWEAPWFGHGLGASRDLGEIVFAGQRFYPPMHPHSASLQLWYETGAVGAGLAALTLVLGSLALARALADKRAAAAAAAGALVSLGFVANVSFSLWAEWWAASLLLAAALVVAAAQRSARR